MGNLPCLDRSTNTDDNTKGLNEYFLAAPIPTSDGNKIGDASLSQPVAPSIDLLKNKTKRKLKLHEFEEQKQKQSTCTSKDNATEFKLSSEEKQLVVEHFKKEHDRLSCSPWKIIENTSGLFNYDTSVGFSNILLLNNNEFIVSPWLNRRIQSTHKDIGIYKYNFIENKWSLFIPYPKIYKVTIEHHQIAIDYDKQIIYINIGCQHICKCYIETKKYEWTQIKTKSKAKELPWNLSAVINGEYHIFLGCNNNTHLKYDDKQQKYDIMHEFEELSMNKGLTSYGMVYNSLDKYYLLFGGYKGKGFGRSDEIYKYYVTKQKWDKLDIVMPDKMQSFGSVITPNCKYVLILGGSNSKGFSNKIYYLNLLTMKWNESKILCPLKHVSNDHVIITPVNNKYINLVNGYIRNIKLEIPLKINKSIKTYLNYIEYLHVLQRSYRHVIADIDYIIS